MGYTITSPVVAWLLSIAQTLAAIAILSFVLAIVSIVACIDTGDPWGLIYFGICVAFFVGSVLPLAISSTGLLSLRHGPLKKGKAVAQPGIFTDLYDGYNATLINGSTAAANALLGAVAPELTAALGLFVIVNGVLVLLRKSPWNTAVSNSVRAVVVAHLLTVGLYNQYVKTMS